MHQRRGNKSPYYPENIIIVSGHSNFVLAQKLASRYFTTQK